MPTSTPEALVIGAGPNGLAAAIELQRNGVSTLVVEAADEIGGGTRSAELTLPGFVHDVCSAVHPMGILSPFYTQLPLEEHGLVWRQGGASVAHPMPDGDAVMIYRSLERTAERLGRDAGAYRRLLAPFVDTAAELLASVDFPEELVMNRSAAAFLDEMAAAGVCDLTALAL